MIAGVTGAIIVAGICLSARVASCIFEDLAESEREKQDEIRKKNEEFKEKRQKYRDAAKAFPDAALEERQRYQALYMAQLREKRSYLLREARKRQKEEEELWYDLNETIIRVRHTLKKETHTLLRRNSLERLLNQLQEAKAKCGGYETYLEKYQEIVNRPIEGENQEKLEALEPFEMHIPKDFPYMGRVLWLSLEQFDEKGEWVDRRIANIPIKYRCDRSEFGWEEIKGQKAPFMVEDFDSSESVYPISLVKGRFIQEGLQDTRTGVKAVVKEILQQGTLLCYEKKLNLFLPKALSVRPYSYPPIRAELEVYPVWWEYGLREGKYKYSVKVSEQAVDATASMQFETFPIVFEKQQWQEVMQYLEKNHLLDLDDEWKVGPMDETDIRMAEGVRMKFQFGDELVLLAQLRYSGEAGETGELLPFFEKILTASESFSCDELFVDIDVQMTPVYRECLDKLTKYVEKENFETFLYDIMAELQTQRKNKLSMAGERYFQQWADVTQKLIEYKRRDHPFEIKAGRVTSDQLGTQIAVADPEKLKKELEAYRDECVKSETLNSHNMKFFAESGDGRLSPVKVDPDCKRIVVSKDALGKYQEGESLIFYAEEVPIPEIQQKQALVQLRSGRIANAQLQIAMMDGKNIVPEDSGDRVQTLNNPSIQQNEAQYKALSGALREKNIFLIQGPPGTGKTTVIRELIQQYQKLHPKAHILVASQANVAVDNALSGLVKMQPERLIRCGKDEKISEDLQKVSLEKRYKEYLTCILESPQELELVQKWLEFVRPQGQNKMQPNIGELLIRDRPVVGATCVGLAKKRIGLERIKFDLVIVDEAGKALPGEILIPILRAKKLVLIGDHKQLPPVIDPALFDPDKIELENRKLMERELLNISFFQRLYERAPESNRAMLETQYRMPAVIGSLVSTLFYDGKLKNGAGTENRPPLFGKGNLVFYDCARDDRYYEQKSEKSDSVVNFREVEIVIEILQKMSQIIPGCRVAVITPYRGQNRILHEAWNQHKEELEPLKLAINTIDAFQGDEAEIVIYCSTRARRTTRYFSDYRRINVALSRAKNKLILIGRLPYFKKYRRGKSPLPEVAEYVEKYGRVAASIENL